MTTTIKPVLSANAETILKKRYLRDQEDAQGLFWRVAHAVAEGEESFASASPPRDGPSLESEHWAAKFYELMASLKFLPNSPTLVNAGRTGRGCLSACFVISPEDTMESIMDVAHAAAMIEKWGGGIGFGLSKLRPKNDKVSTTHGKACGPVAVMKLYSTIGATLTQGSFRLGAHMAQLRDSHPDIQEFIHCKDGDDALQNFNISVQVTDEFMKAVQEDRLWRLFNPRDEGIGPVDEWTGDISAKALWDEIVDSAWRTGDPGVVFIDRVWETAPNPHLGRIESSNPCGEEFLEDYGNCCLGSINLDRHVELDHFDWNLLDKTVRTAVRFLDDVIEVNEFPLERLKEVNLQTRRIGLGVMGWADALVRMEIPYDSEEALKLADEVGGFIERVAWETSADLAEERGAYPEYDNSALREQSEGPNIGNRPVRHSSVITIAPTGTISRIAGCSSGIEPHFALAWYSNILWEGDDGEGLGRAHERVLDMPNALREWAGRDKGLEAVLEDAANGYPLIRAGYNSTADSAQQVIKNLQHIRTTHEISPQAHVKMQAAWQRHTTNSVSKTINLPNDATKEDVAGALWLAWEEGCKAVTVYRDGSKGQQVLETGGRVRPEPLPGGSISQEAVKAAVSKVMETYPADTHYHGRKKLPDTRPAKAHHFTVGGTEGYLHVGMYPDTGEMGELFVTASKQGSTVDGLLDAVAILVSISVQYGVPLKQLTDKMRGRRFEPSGLTGNKDIPTATSLIDYIFRWLEREFVPEGERISDDGTGMECPDCGAAAIAQEGCLVCREGCGWQKC